MAETGTSRNRLVTSLLPVSLLEYSELRVTNQVKMTNCIQHSLTHFRDKTNCTTPFLLHTLPPNTPTPGPSTSTPSITTNIPLPAPLPTATATATATALPSTTKKSPSSALPKLISIVEIIKNNYEALPLPLPSELVLEGAPIVLEEESSKAKGKGKGKAKEKKPKLEGLHQYTRLGALEELGMEDKDVLGDDDGEREQERMDDVALKWIKGKGASKRPRMKHTPFMIIILSAVRIPSLSNFPVFTYQAPAPIPRKRPLENAEDNQPAGGGEGVPRGEEGGEAMIVDKEGEGDPAKKKRKRKHSKKKKGTTENAGNGAKAMEVDPVPDPVPVPVAP